MPGPPVDLFQAVTQLQTDVAALQAKVALAGLTGPTGATGPVAGDLPSDPVTSPVNSSSSMAPKKRPADPVKSVLGSNFSIAPVRHK